MRYLFMFFAFIIPLLFVACGDDDPGWPDNDPDWWRGMYVWMTVVVSVCYFAALRPKRK